MASATTKRKPVNYTQDTSDNLSIHSIDKSFESLTSAMTAIEPSTTPTQRKKKFIFAFEKTLKNASVVRTEAFLAKIQTKQSQLHSNPLLDSAYSVRGTTPTKSQTSLSSLSARKPEKLVSGHLAIPKEWKGDSYSVNTTPRKGFFF